MLRFFVLPCVAVLLGGCSTNPEKRLPRAAADAMTGSPWTLGAIASLTMEGTGVIRELASDKFSGRSLTVASFRRVLNFGKRQWRGDMTVVPTSTRSAPERLSMGLIGNRAFQWNMERDQAPGTGDPWLRSEVLRHPVGFLRAAFSGTLPLSGTRREEGMNAVDLSVDGTRYTLFLDSATSLPIKILATSEHPVSGDMAIETDFPSYKTIHGYKLPSRIVTSVGGEVIEDLKIEQQFVSADTVALAMPERL